MNRRTVVLASVGTIFAAVGAWVCISFFLVFYRSDTVQMQSCIENPDIWQPTRAACRLALYRFHPTPDDIRHLNTIAGAAFAAELNDEADARRLLAHLLASGLDVNARATNSPSGFTALHLAASGRKVHAVRLLIEFGADPVLRDATGRTPLDMARELQARYSGQDYAQVIRVLESTVAQRSATSTANAPPAASQ